MYTTLITKRLKIRPLALTDKDFIYSLTNTSGWLQFIGDRNIKNVLDAENYIKKILGSPNYYYSIFELNDSKKPIGIVTFVKRDNQEFQDFGFATLAEYEGKGFTYEASKKYLESLDENGSYDTILGITKPTNIKSISLLEKLGFNLSAKQTINNDSVEIYKRTTNR